MYSKDQKLNLSKKLLDSIKEWSEKEGKEKEEKELAQKLYEDFSRFPTAEENINVNNNEVKYESTIDIKSEEEKVKKERKQNAESAKEKGNELFNNRNYKEAINQYTKAIEFDSSKYLLFILINSIFFLMLFYFILIVVIIMQTEQCVI